MRLHIHDTLIYDPLLPLSEQSEATQEHLYNIAFDYNHVNAELSLWQGDDTPGQPVRYDKLVHDVPTQEGPVVRTTVDWRYRYEYGHPACFSGTHTVKAEVVNG